MPEPIVEAADLTAYQGGDSQTLIDQATALVRRYCGWHVTPSITETVTLDGPGLGLQVLPSLHVTAVTSVTYDGTLLDPTDYTWSRIGLLQYEPFGPFFAESCRWPVGFGKVSVVMTHGFPDAPDLAAVVMAVAARAQVSPNGVVRTQAGPFSETYSQTGFNVAGGVSLVPHEVDILDRYRLAPRP